MKIFSTSRVIPAKSDRIFEAFRDPEKLARWWGPAGFSNTFSRFEFTTGGRWSFVMHGPDGTNYPNESEFQEIVPGEKIVIRHHSQPNFTLTIILEAAEAGSFVKWIQDFDSEETAKNVADIVQPANEQNLDRLASEVLGA
jgi:uncharacterized protein YndB with AHSA1/START domain